MPIADRGAATHFSGVIELKTGRCKTEYAGKLKFEVGMVDDVLRRQHDNETLGILICGSKDDRSVRYSFGRTTSPLAAASYKYEALPNDVRQGFPDANNLTVALE